MVLLEVIPADAHGQFFAWLTVNSLALLAIVYRAGGLVARLEALEKNASQLWSKINAVTDMPAKVEGLCDRVDELKESINTLQQVIYKLSVRP